MYQALYQTYRPQTFDAVYGQRHITDTLKNQVRAGRVSHAYLFTGTRGTGKTTCARILARAVNCENPQDGNPCNVCPACRGITDGRILDVLEIDAASNTGVDNIRALLDETTYPPAGVRRRVYIIDEVHMLSAGAFNALLKTLEEPPEYVMFILATTEIHRVAATILSRCQRFDFRRVEPTQLAANLSHIAEAEGINIAPAALELLSKLADGSARDSITLLERCLVGASGETLTEDAVVAAMGISPNSSLSALSSALAAHDASAALLALDRIYMDGLNIRAALERLAAYFRDVLLYQTAPNAADALSSPGFDRAAVLADVSRFSPARVIAIITALQKTIDSLTVNSGGRLEAELCLIKLCAPDEVFAAPVVQVVQPAPQPAPVVQAPPPVLMHDAPPFPIEPERSPTPPPAPKPIPEPVKAPAHAPAENELDPAKKSAILKSLSGVVSRSVYSFLIPAKWMMDGRVLTVMSEGEMSVTLLDKPDIRAAIAAAAANVVGECTVRVTSPAKEKRGDNRFEGFDRIMQAARGLQINNE